MDVPESPTVPTLKKKRLFLPIMCLADSGKQRTAIFSYRPKQFLIGNVYVFEESYKVKIALLETQAQMAYC